MWKFTTILLLILVAGFLGLVVIRPDLSQNLLDEFHDLVQIAPPVSISTATPSPTSAPAISDARVTAIAQLMSSPTAVPVPTAIQVQNPTPETIAAPTPAPTPLPMQTEPTALPSWPLPTATPTVTTSPTLTPTPTITPTHTPLPTPIGIVFMPSLDLPAIWGSRANTGIGLAFRVIEATRGVHDWFWASNDGCEFIRVMIQAENIGRESIRVQDGEFSIRGRGLRYPCNGNSFAFGPSYEPFEDDINPGEKIIRYFMAEVPKTATDLKLVYRDPDHHWMRAALSLSRDLKDRAKVSIPINLASELTMSPTPIATTLTNTPIPTATAIPSLISNPSPTITPMPTITPTPTQTSTPTTTSTPSSTPTSTATSTITPTPTPVPPSGLSQSQLADARKYALRLINDARTAAGLNTVVLDDNTAAQSHAKDMQENCSTGHWGTDGLKPYMRYTLSGGEEYTSENVSGSGFCPTNPDRYISKTIDAHIDEAMNGLMNSPGHRRNILNPHHRKVNIGISYRHPNLWLVQHFVSDYLDYKTKPTIEDGVLKFSGQTKNGAIATERALGVQIFYDQTPHSLTRGQLHQTYCYTFGTIIAALRRPPGPSAHYPTNSFTLSGTGCNDPYDVPIDAAPASSYFDTKTAFTFPWTERAVWITASRWPIGGKTFEVFANLSDLIDRLGDGVYTILIWGEINGEDVPISEYSIFIPPYSPAP